MRLTALATAAAAVLALAAPALAERLTDQPLVDSAWLQSHLGNESLVILDVRDAVEKVYAYDAAHIPGAIKAPYSTSGWREELQGVPGQFPGVEKAAALVGSFGVDNDEHVVIVPNGTDSSEFGAATRIYWTFKVLGHDAVSILDGGARAWEAADGRSDAARRHHLHCQFPRRAACRRRGRAAGPGRRHAADRRPPGGAVPR